MTLPGTIRKYLQKSLEGFRKIDSSVVWFYLILILPLFPLFFFQIRSNDFWTALYSGRYLSTFNAFAHHSTYTFVPVKDVPGFFENPFFGVVHWGTFNWLAYIIFYEIHQLGGIPALQLLRLSIGFASIILLHSLVQYRTNVYLFVLFVLYGHGIYLRLTMRNYLFTVILVPLLFLVWKKVRYDGDFRWVYLLPVILLLWSNTHASYLIGLGIFLCILVGDLIDSVRNDVTVFPIHGRTWLILLGTTLLVIWIKPIPDYMWLNYTAKFLMESKEFFSGPWGGFSTNTMGGFLSKSWNQLLHELVPLHRNLLIPDRETAVSGYSHPVGYLDLGYVLASLILVPLGLSLLAFLSRKVRFSEMIPAIVIIVAASGRLRTLAYLPLVIVPILLIKYNNNELFFPDSLRIPTRYLSLAGMIIFLIISVHYTLTDSYHKLINIYPHRTDWGVWRKYSKQIPRKILKKHPEERFFNNFGIGSFLIWNWWPHKKVYFEPKWAPYPSTFIKHRLNRLEEFGINHALLTLNVDHLNKLFLDSPEWRILYKDSVMISYERDPQKSFINR